MTKQPVFKDLAKIYCNNEISIYRNDCFYYNWNPFGNSAAVKSSIR